jgi:hypothetical protein
MSDHSVHKASDLPGDERLLVERWLGRLLADDETISVSVYRPHPQSTGDKSERLRREIVAQSHEIGSRAPQATDDEIDALVDEAFTHTRGRRS